MKSGYEPRLLIVVAANVHRFQMVTSSDEPGQSDMLLFLIAVLNVNRKLMEERCIKLEDEGKVQA
jgi:hypothetical protein